MTENSVRSKLQASSCGSWPFAGTVACPDPSIDRRSYMQSDVGKAPFLTLNKALAQGMIEHDMDFFREGLREVKGQ